MGLLDSFFGGTSKSKQTRRFSPEGKEALRQEVPIFLQIAPLLNALQQGILTPGGGLVGQGIQSAGAAALPSIEATGIAAGLDTATLAELLQDLSPEDPAFQDILRQLSQSVATSVPSTIDPRFAVGLRPGTSTQTTSQPSPFQIASQLGGLGVQAATLGAG